MKSYLKISSFVSQILLACAPYAYSENLGIGFCQIDFDELKEYIVLPDTIIIDARPPVFYELGHIPNAKNLPLIDFEASFKKINKECDLKKYKRIVVYCTDYDCDDSTNLGRKLSIIGLANIMIYKGGWKEWKERQK